MFFVHYIVCSRADESLEGLTQGYSLAALLHTVISLFQNSLCLPLSSSFLVLPIWDPPELLLETRVERLAEQWTRHLLLGTLGIQYGPDGSIELGWRGQQRAHRCGTIHQHSIPLPASWLCPLDLNGLNGLNGPL